MSMTMTMTMTVTMTEYDYHLPTYYLYLTLSTKGQMALNLAESNSEMMNGCSCSTALEKNLTRIGNSTLQSATPRH